jgi:hypothetical protein
LGGSHDRQEALHCQAILHSFAWTLAQACYLGNTLHEIIVVRNFLISSVFFKVLVPILS